MSITPKGYRMSLNDPRVKIIEKELKVKPFVPDGYSKEYKLYRKSDKYIYCPRFYLIDKIGLPKEIVYHPTEKVNINILKEPREYQISVTDKVLKHIQNHKSGVCSLYTGWGKTFLTLWIASKLSKKTLIVVHTKSLLEQWIIKIKEFTGIDAGIIQQNKMYIESPICVGIIHSLCLRDYPKEITEAFGFIAFDEVHHTPSEMFSGVFFKMYIEYSFGISATLKRTDGLSKVVNWFLGETIVDIKQVTDKPTILLSPFYPSIPFEEQLMINGKPNRMAMITDLCVSNERNEFIINIVNQNTHRIILILTHIRSHAELLHSRIPNSGLYMGKMSQDELNMSNTKNVIIGTYNMASEGYDNPRLDTLILSTPKSNIEQSVGRILRQKNSNDPLVIDIQDFHSLFIYANYKRIKYYKNQGFIDTKEKNKSSIEDYEIKEY